MSWYNEGEKGAQKAKDEDSNRQKNFDSPFRFWLAPEKSTKFVFLDTDGFFFKEHNLNLNGHWRNWETCISDLGEEECPICEQGFKYSYVAVFSIIDLTKYKDKQGNQVKASKKLLVLKTTARNKILKQKERREGNLTGCVFETTRYNQKECSTGEDFEYLKRVPVEDLKEMAPQGVDAEEFVRPFDYIKLFNPKTAVELRRVIGAAPPVGSEDSPAATAQSDSNDGNVGDAKPESLKDLL